MLPIDPRIKIVCECVFMVILLTYAARSEFRQRQHLTASISAALCVPLLIDVLIFHAVRPVAVWAVLNVPFLAAVGGFVYVKILHKGVRKAFRRLVSLFLLLVGR